MRVTVVSAEDRPDDIDQRTARLDRNTLTALGASPGDVLAVRGDDETALTVQPWSDPPGEGLAVSAVDAANAGVDPGESVTVECITPPVADRVSLRLANEGKMGSFDVAGGQSAVRNVVDGHPLAVGDRLSQSVLGGTFAMSFITEHTQPPGPVIVTSETDITIETAAENTAPASQVTVDELGGLDEVLDTLRRRLRLALERPGIYDQFGTTPSGTLVVGPAGVGKTSVAVALANETTARFLPVRPGGEYHNTGGSVDAPAIRNAVQDGPTLVFFDDLDVLAPATNDASRDGSTATLGRLVDDLVAAEHVAVLAAATDPASVASSLRRGGRFGHEVSIETPDREARRDILAVHFADVPLTGVSLDQLVEHTPGFVGADIKRLATAAVANAIDRRGIEVSDPLPSDMAVRPPDVNQALATVAPSALADHTVEQPDVSYDDIGGLTAVKRELVRAVEWPLVYPDLFEQVQNDPPAGILLYGPPGTGKTMLAKAVANSSGANFVSVSGPELFDRYVGESERAVREIFERARQNAPAVVFFDEVDALATRRDAAEESDVSDRVVSQLLTELDGIEPRSGVTVVGTTNRPERIDRALLRSGRFEKILEVPLPDREARQEIFETHLAAVPATEPDPDVGSLAAATDGYSGSDIAAVIREAGMLAMENALREHAFDGDKAAETVAIGEAHLEQAVEVVDRSVTEQMREAYESRAEDLRR